jgi:hypothetical protein
MAETNNHGTERPIDTAEKALAVNLDPLRYGSFAEIGAGQEVVRWFFRVGGAAGTVAKSMSAYDMAISDVIYGKAGRYVSRERLDAMLEREYRLNLERLGAARGDKTAFFAFADTVSAQSFRGNPNCRGWLGIRFQAAPGEPHSQVVLHVRMRDPENIQQQEALGIVGVNLIYAAFELARDPDQLLASMLDGLTHRRLEIDMVELSGAAFGDVDNRLLSLKLVELRLTDAAMFSTEGRVLQASDALYKKPIVVQGGSFSPPTLLHSDLHRCAREQFGRDIGASQDELVSVAELSLSGIGTDPDRPAQHRSFLDRVDALALVDIPCVVTRHPEHYRIAEYLARQTAEPIAMAMGVDTLESVFDETYYEDLPGGLLEAMGRLFRPNIRVYAHPWRDPQTGELVTAKTLRFPPETTPLFRYVADRGLIRDIEGYDESLLGIRTREVAARIRAGGDWETAVQPRTAALIKRKGLFGHPAGA